MNRQPIYFSSIRRMIIAFGTIFNEMYILRKDENGNTVKELKVPFEYGSKTHWYRRIKELEKDSSFNKVIPRISFLVTSMTYDPSRKMNTMNFNSRNIAEDLRAKQLAPVPYNIGVEMTVWAKNMEDGLMIVEQILPLFAPQINLKIREVDDLDIWNDVDIVLNGVSMNDTFEEQLDTDRLLTFTFDCTIRGNVYPTIRNEKLVHKAVIDFDNAYLDPASGLERLEQTANQTNPADYDKNNSETSIIPEPGPDDEII